MLHYSYYIRLTLCVQVAGFFGVIWLLSLLFYLFSYQLEVSVYISPLVLTVFCLLYLCNPFRILHYRARRWLLRVLVFIIHGHTSIIDDNDYKLYISMWFTIAPDSMMHLISVLVTGDVSWRQRSQPTKHFI